MRFNLTRTPPAKTPSIPTLHRASFVRFYFAFSNYTQTPSCYPYVYIVSTIYYFGDDAVLGAYCIYNTYVLVDSITTMYPESTNVHFSTSPLRCFRKNYISRIPTIYFHPIVHFYPLVYIFTTKRGCFSRIRFYVTWLSLHHTSSIHSPNSAVESKTSMLALHVQWVVQQYIS